MSNNFFRFRLFRIDQEHCGMKVSTDACILGAWAPVPTPSCRILDIGTGTGLLALMLAQRAPLAAIDALEMDRAAADQARGNIRQSPFAARVQVHETDARLWHGASGYDMIICNPPFFHKSLHSPAAARNMARHDASLTGGDLLDIFDRQLAAGGYAVLLWPEAEGRIFAGQANARGWELARQLCIKDKTAAPVKRLVQVFQRAAGSLINEDLVIKQDNGSYTAAFTALLSPFYLYL